MRNFFACDIGVRNRLVLENEDKGFWSCQNLYKYFYSYMRHVYNFNFPLTLDNLHDKCNPSKDQDGNGCGIIKISLIGSYVEPAKGYCFLNEPLYDA